MTKENCLVAHSRCLMRKKEVMALNKSLVFGLLPSSGGRHKSGQCLRLKDKISVGFVALVQQVLRSRFVCKSFPQRGSPQKFAITLELVEVALRSEVRKPSLP